MPDTAYRTLGRILTNFGTVAAGETVLVVGLAGIVDAILINLGTAVRAELRWLLFGITLPTELDEGLGLCSDCDQTASDAEALSALEIADCLTLGLAIRIKVEP